MNKATVIGAGLAGCEAAWQLARRGIIVDLIEMKPQKKSPAHVKDTLAELVCSNSLRGAQLSTAPGLLKQELRVCGSLLMTCADASAVPAGGALAVDREMFSAKVTEQIKNCRGISIIQAEADSIPEGNVIIATGPLTMGEMAAAIQDVTGAPMFFYDAAAPVVTFDSIDMDSGFYASRYGKGSADYINCPMNKEEYEAFVTELAAAEQAHVHGFEDNAVFEGCMPVEVMARRGMDTLRYGPLKPVGLDDPQTGRRPYAVVQLRAENLQRTMYNLVGFQTHLRQPEQRRVFGMIPALRHAEYLRYGAMHRNSYIKSPGTLDRFYGVMGREELVFAGQITGVEGYIESIASGLYAGINMARRIKGQTPFELSGHTAIGALARYISTYPGDKFQPMNINFGIIDDLPERIKAKKDRNEAIAKAALAEVEIKCSEER